MPAFSKKSLSLFLRNGCERQFILSLYKDAERRALGMAPRQQARAGLGLAGEAGYEWQDQKVSELKDIFGEANVHVNPVTNGRRPGTRDLLTTLSSVTPYQFIVEAAYRADTDVFRSAVGMTDLRDVYGNSVDISQTHPDIVQVLPSLAEDASLGIAVDRNPYAMEVLPTGAVKLLNLDDYRLRLRVIDIKLTSEPGAHYFAEVVYYSMTLAAWLIEHRLDSQFVVVAAPAIWPGSHEASHLAQQSSLWQRQAHQALPAEMAAALEADLEIASFEVYAPRLRHFLAEQLPTLLNMPWFDLRWHVDFRCKGCEFLGYPWRDQNGKVLNDPSQCWPTAEASGHLSRVVGLSRGGSEHLRTGKVRDVTALASTPATSPIFDDHQGLRAKRATFPYRAHALQQGVTSVIPNSGGDALMPRWPDLHVYLFLDYDLSRAITASIALRAFWKEPLSFDSQLQPQMRAWTQRQNEDEVFLVDRPSLEREGEEVLKFLRQLRKIFTDVTKADTDDTLAKRRVEKKHQISTYQIYLWDEAQRKHLVRIIGRHLAHILADPQLRDLAWLFPPPELLQHAEDATRQSPITLVKTVLDNTVAVPVAHHYRLLDVVQTYLPANNSPQSVHPLYQEPMSDLIPTERIHEWWQRMGHWSDKQDLIRETARKKVHALNLVVRRLEIDLADVLSRQAAPPLVRSQRPVAGVAPQSRLWYEYTRLNAAFEGLEVTSIRAMPPDEREARLKAARLMYRLMEEEEETALAALGQTLGRPLAAAPDLLVYKMRDTSCDVNLKPGDFDLALAPDNQFGFLDSSPYPYVKGTVLEDRFGWSKTVADGGLTAVSIEAIDRANGYLALRASPDSCIPELEQVAGLDFSRDVILDPVHKNFLSGKVKLTLQGIGDPPNAKTDQRTLEALGLPTNTSPGKSAVSLAAELLWEAPKLRSQPTQRDLKLLKRGLQGYFAKAGVHLDDSQWHAWEDALSYRLSLIWGPPGTGKSRTLRAIILATVLDALGTQQPLRLIITANTYTAIDNVLLTLAKEMQELLPGCPFDVYRVQSKWRQEAFDLAMAHANIQNLTLNTHHPSDAIKGLLDRLEQPNGIVIIGCPPQQLHNLAIAGKSSRQRKPKDTIRSWFDVIVLDEASQMDVASSTLVFTKLAQNGVCILAGDDLQLPPIQQAEPPKNLEHVVGSVYNYYRHHHGIVPSALDINYRSNSTIVAFTRLAGYSPSLSSYSPDLRLNLLSRVTEKPTNWPVGLFWSAEWDRFLDPAYPAVAFVYDDKLSSQINDFEADVIAALIWLLRESLANSLLNERMADGTNRSPSQMLCTSREFWNNAVGVVTPHRVQMGKIVQRLQQTFPTDSKEDIRGAVDTVERFQGQQRDVILASFGIGDPDIISAEDQFLYSLNRFNVLTSRARAKLIVFVTRSLLEHLSDDSDVLAESRLLKQFAEFYCTNIQSVQLGWTKNGNQQSCAGLLRRV